MVRPPPARPHPSLYDPTPALGDRAGRRARLPPLPVRLAARVGGDTVGRVGCASGRARRAGRVRGAGPGVGDRDPAGAPRGLRTVLARRSLPRWPDRLGALGAASRRERPDASGRTGPLGADCPAGPPAGAALDVAGAAG